MPTRKLMSMIPREYLSKGDYMGAFAMASADLESILFQKLLFEKEIKAELMEKWSLSTFIQWNLKLGLIDAKWEPLLNDFRRLRNEIIHKRGYLNGLVKDPERLKQAETLLLSICDFVDQVEVSYVWDPDLEAEYSKAKRH